MTKIFCTTWRHLGDTILMGAALRNLELAHGGEFEVWHTSPYQDLFVGWEYVHIGCPAGAREVKVSYGARGEEKTAARGTIQEAYTRSLSDDLGIQIPALVRTMPVYLTDEERRKYAELEGCVILNANCQECSMTKRYPYWQTVTDMLSDHKVVLIGGTEGRDVRESVSGAHVVNIRGETSIRDLMGLCAACGGVISPASGIVHLAAALGKPAVYLTAAREPIGLIEYPGCVPMASSCQNRRYHPDAGCGHMFSCEGQIEINGQKYPSCFTAIRPEDIVAEARFCFWGRFR